MSHCKYSLNAEESNGEQEIKKTLNIENKK